MKIALLHKRLDLKGGTEKDLYRTAEGLRDLGYLDGQNVALEFRYQEGRRDADRELVVELVRIPARATCRACGP